MKDKNLPNNYNSLSLEELTKEANKMIENLENQKDFENSIDSYNNLLKLNNLIEKKFKKNIKDISRKTKEKISEITLKRKHAKKIKSNC